MVVVIQKPVKICPLAGVEGNQHAIAAQQRLISLIQSGFRVRRKRRGAKALSGLEITPLLLKK